MEASEVAMIVGETVRACLKQFTLSPLLTIDEIAEKLKISKDAVRAYIRSGELKAYELGARLVRVEIAEVNEFLAKMQVRSQDSETGKDSEVARLRDCEVMEQKQEAEKEGETVTEPEEKLEPEKEGESARSQDCEVAEPEPEKDREMARLQDCEVAEPEKPEEDQGFIQCDAVHPKTGVRCTLEKGHEGKHCCRKEVAA